MSYYTLSQFQVGYVCEEYIRRLLTYVEGVEILSPEEVLEMYHKEYEKLYSLCEEKNPSLVKFYPQPEKVQGTALLNAYFKLNYESISLKYSELSLPIPRYYKSVKKAEGYPKGWLTERSSKHVMACLDDLYKVDLPVRIRGKVVFLQFTCNDSKLSHKLKHYRYYSTQELLSPAEAVVVIYGDIQDSSSFSATLIKRMANNLRQASLAACKHKPQGIGAVAFSTRTENVVHPKDIDWRNVDYTVGWMLKNIRPGPAKVIKF